MKGKRSRSSSFLYDRALFDHSARWDIASDPKQEERVTNSLAAIPQGVETILDVGCGNGLVTRRIATTYRVVGCDSSSLGLRSLQLPGVQASLTELPFKGKSFDLVTAFEVLEHLPPHEIERACSEMARVAIRYLLISVPRSEDLESRMTRCPDCGWVFHAYNHLSSFNPDRMRGLVPGCVLLQTYLTHHRRFGAERLPRLLRWLRLPGYVWAPNMTCPRCKRTDFPHTWSQKWTLRLIHVACRLIPRWRMPAGWIISLYEKTRSL